MKLDISMEISDIYLDEGRWKIGSCKDVEFEGWCGDCNQHTKICRLEDQIDTEFMNATIKGINNGH